MIVMMKMPPTMVAAAAYPNFRSLYASLIYTGRVLKLGGYRIVVIARLNTLPPNAASTADTELSWINGSRMVRILVR